MSKPLRVLLIEDSEDDAQLIVMELERGGYAVEFERVYSSGAVREAFERGMWDLVVADYAMPGFSGPAALLIMREQGLDLPFILVSGTVGEDVAVESMKAGAHDYIMKDNLRRLVPAVNRELAEAAIRRKKREAEREIAESRDFLENIFNTMPNVIMVTNKSGYIIRVNKAIESMLGIPVGKFFGKHTAELAPQDEKHQFIAIKLMSALRERGHLKAFEAEWLRKDGSLCPVEMNITMMKNQEGNRIGSVSVVQEISERKKAEEELKNRIRQQSALARFSEHAIATVALQDLLNEGALLVSQTLGVEFCKILELLPDGNNLLLRAGVGWKQGLVGKMTVPATADTQAGFTLRSNALVMVEDLASETRFNGAPFLREHGVVSGISLVISLSSRPYGVLSAHSTGRRDFTRDEVSFLQSAATIVSASVERLQAQRNIEESREYLRNIINAIGVPVFVKDREHRMIMVNDAECALMQTPREEIVGRTAHEIFPKNMADVSTKQDEEVFRTGKENISTADVPDPQGNLRASITRKTLCADKYGNQYIVGVVHDITDIKRAEADREKLRNQLYQSQKMEAIGHLAGGVAHDFNNILTAIIGYGNLLQIKIDAADPLRHNVDQILTASERAASLVHSLLAFSKKQIINPQPVTMQNIVTGVAKLLHRLIGEDIDLNVAFTEQDTVVLADIGQIDQVLINLATNARDAMPNGGSLSISTGTADIDETYIKRHGYGVAGHYALITVTDSGAGMDKQTSEQIFEPFFTTKEVGKGTGLGLSTAYGIVKQHNGYINCYSEPGKGTTFKIYLPIVTDVERVKQQTAAGKPHRLVGGTETILLAEDDETIRTLTAKMLSQFGYTVIESVDGEDAIAKFKEHQGGIQLLLLDVIMPKKNGREVLTEIQKLQPGIKAVFTSGYTADIIQKSDFIEKGLDFLMKPVSMPDLLHKLREVLDR
jgi:PAS domain S-box-containing protein